MFVDNRVKEIRKLTNKTSWFYCDSKNNPSDLLTKIGFSLVQLKEKHLWWEGPSFLKDQKFKSKHHENVLYETIIDKTDVIPTPTLLSSQTPQNGIDKIIDINRFSNVHKLYRITAWVKRFCFNLKNTVNEKTNEKFTEHFLTATELRHSENAWIKINQNSFENNKLKELKKELNVIIDKENLFRCEGRLQYAPLPYESKTPILLNEKHKLSELIVKYIHEQYKHIGLKQTLTELRQRFWIVKGRSFVRGVLRKCVVCRRFEGKTYRYPVTPPLTPLRLNDSRPFATTGVDNFGPVYIKNVYNESDKIYKAWVTLYTCASSRAIILDLIPGMDAPAIIRSIRRFISRRGCPSNVISDNGKNFISQETGEFITNIGIEWHYNLPLVPCPANT